ncbi:malto-oligosyltrehalose synthase [Rhizobium sp. Leaf262]|uniref:malto-oligosyltrehalose synthase n=1 Tax=Rhizobium sp. Leaf262 TaxID=1736312 RepID=UPI00071245BE|nr:malto-oligosyltrehalose synthase [Rhizobium sp. Leaf262]KQO74954.1 malto-oligosyltrehalose synthase [Rhizobium sp. Leaf262]
MTIPTSTYRIQFRNGMTFDRAVELVPYLQKLGISHLYASPIFTATTDSTHGYDVTNANEIDPVLGGRQGFERLVSALKAAGLGIILDIVPNHMAASLENAWWKDVIEHGAASRYARHFDIDWSRRLTLPFLGDDFATVLAKGDISLQTDPQSGKPSLCCYGAYYPLNPATYSQNDAILSEPQDAGAISDLHDRQAYRLTSWRDACRDLSYRRFFEVTGLVGVRVEDREIFEDTHRLILELVRNGLVDGLRVDHVDGLADPKAYLERLRSEAGAGCYITVEKILGPSEQLSAGWPVSGTTGYEFISALSNLFVDNEKLDDVRKAYEECEGRSIDMPAELRAAKLLMVDVNFAGEFDRLLNLAKSILATDITTPEADAEGLRAALRELVVSFPVYRTYGTADGLPSDSQAVLADAVDHIRTGPDAPEVSALAALQNVLRNSKGAKAEEFRTRFQQLTGPLMAKSVEDTLFYRQNAVIALNEVGAEPLQRTFSVDQFHAHMADRLMHQPDALSATSTHDTKRGEDARARLYAITEAPDIWVAAFKRWQGMNGWFKTTLDDGCAPEPATEWLLYQALAGVWPIDLRAADTEGLKELEERFISYVEKALREAKLRTNWGDGNEIYEKAVIGYARRLVSPDNSDFLSDFVETLQRFIEAGLSNSLSQTLIKLTAPGVPDIYQGSEALDLSLVDPDNRRMPDYETLAARLEKRDESGGKDTSEGGVRLKQHLIATVLRLRQEKPDLFVSGTYIPLTSKAGESAPVVAFARVAADNVLITVAPRLSMTPRLAGDIALPPELGNATYVDVLTGAAWTFGDAIDVAQVAGKRKLALLARQ